MAKRWAWTPTCCARRSSARASARCATSSPPSSPTRTIWSAPTWTPRCASRERPAPARPRSGCTAPRTCSTPIPSAAPVRRAGGRAQRRVPALHRPGAAGARRGRHRAGDRRRAGRATCRSGRPRTPPSPPSRAMRGWPTCCAAPCSTRRQTDRGRLAIIGHPALPRRRASTAPLRRRRAGTGRRAALVDRRASGCGSRSPRTSAASARTPAARRPMPRRPGWPARPRCGSSSTRSGRRSTAPAAARRLYADPGVPAALLGRHIERRRARRARLAVRAALHPVGALDRRRHGAASTSSSGCSTALTGYVHVVVDEAQDLSAMQCRAVARRCPLGSVTVLGDLAQATTSVGARVMGGHAAAPRPAAGRRPPAHRGLPRAGRGADGGQPAACRTSPPTCRRRPPCGPAGTP